jgi:hypothetical protein|nr:hypothetical protein [Kofleriaceae bacterium]
MTTSKRKQSLRELSTDALDVVLGGSAPAPMGLGGSLPSSQTQSSSPFQHATTSGAASAGVGYTDHFGLHLGGGAGGGGDAAPSSDPGHAAGPQGMGGSDAHDGSSHDGNAHDGSHDGNAHDGDNHGEYPPAHSGSADHHDGSPAEQLAINADSAFQLLDQAQPTDAQASAADHGAAPEGLGGTW